MPTRRLIALVTTGFGLAGLLTVQLMAGQQATKPMAGHGMGMAGSTKTMTKAQKIANAVAAAPATVSANATVFDWPAKEGMAPEVLRQGTNGWSCFPDYGETQGNDPLCVDEPWMKWFEAYMSKKTPVTNRVGVGYMMAAGGGWASNTDPFAMKQTMDNHWGHHQPHLMVIVPDQKALAGISTDAKNGGPYVMFAGTPYAHVMIPVGTVK